MTYCKNCDHNVFLIQGKLIHLEIPKGKGWYETFCLDLNDATKNPDHYLVCLCGCKDPEFKVHDATNHPEEHKICEFCKCDNPELE